METALSRSFSADSSRALSSQDMASFVEGTRNGVIGIFNTFESAWSTSVSSNPPAPTLDSPLSMQLADVATFCEKSKSNYLFSFGKLIRESGDINAKNSEGITILMKAALLGQEDLLHLALQCDGIRINERDVYGNTALIKAAEHGQEKAVRILLGQWDILVNEVNKVWKTALVYASLFSRVEIVYLLLIDSRLNLALHDQWENACDVAKFFEIYAMIEEKLEQSNLGTRLIQDISNSAEAPNALSRQERIRMIVQSCRSTKNNLLHYFAELLHNSNDLHVKNQRGCTLLHLAVENQNMEIIKLLGEELGELVQEKDVSGNTPLLSVAQTGNMELFKILLAQPKVLVNEANEVWHTAFTWAAKHNCSRRIKLLLDHPEFDIFAHDQGKSAFGYTSAPIIRSFIRAKMPLGI